MGRHIDVSQIFCICHSHRTRRCVNRARCGPRGQTDAQILRKAVARFNDPGFNHHLPYRQIHLGNQLPDIFQPARRILHEQDIGSRIDYGAAPLRQHALVRIGQQFLNGLRLLIVQLETFSAQRLQVTDLRLRLEVELFLRGDFLTRCNQDHIAILAHVQPALLHDDVQRLIPRHVLQNQGNRPLHRVTDHHVHSGELADYLQQTTDVDVLEIERQLLALVAAARSLYQLVRIFDDLLDLDNELIVGLVGIVLPQPTRGNRHARVGALLNGVDCGHRRGKIGDIEAFAQGIRHIHFDKIDNQILPLLADVDTGVGIA